MALLVATRTALALAIMARDTLCTAGGLVTALHRDATVLIGADGNELKPGAMPVFRLSTDGEAEDGNILEQHWDLSRAESGIAPILANHRVLGTDAPYGLGLWRNARVVDGPSGRELHADADFDMEDPVAERVAGKVRRAYLRSVSVGWRPGGRMLRGDLPKDHPRYRAPQTDDCGTRIEGYTMGTEGDPNRLIEASMTPIPSDPGAVQVDGKRSAMAMRDIEALATGGRMSGDVGSLLLAIRDRPGVREWARSILREELATPEGRALFRSIFADVPPAPVSFSVEDLLQ